MSPPQNPSAAATTTVSATTTTTTTIVSATFPVIKQLASCNKTTREKSLKLLTKWLPLQNQLSPDDMKKLWKALFYCIWHADKPQFQHQLISRLAALLLNLPLGLGLDYFDVFLVTLRREWAGIDRLRLDKFYLLVRRFINSMFGLLKKNGWDVELSKRVMFMLEENLFSLSYDRVDQKFGGNGVAYHVASVFVEELKTYLPVREEVLEVLFRPFSDVMCKSRDKVLVGKVKSNVFDYLLRMGKSLFERLRDSAENGGDDEVLNVGTIALKMGFAAKFYDLGSAVGCFQGNRKVLFNLHEEFLKLEKDLEASGINVSFPEVVAEDDDKVPELVPIVNNGSDSIMLVEAPAVVQEVGGKKSLKSKKEKAKKGSEQGKSEKKKEKAKKGSEQGKSEKKKKEKAKKGSEVGMSENDNMVTDNGGNSSNETSMDVSTSALGEYTLSNLQREFEKIAQEEGLAKDGSSSLNDSTPKKVKVSKKRKRAKSVDRLGAHNSEMNADGDAAAMSGLKSAKKVRFSMKNNLVWKPQTPLPPQSVRIPPSVTPRGSALKKGVPPGPVREMPPATKRMKQKKKARKLKRTAFGLRKLQVVSI